MAALLCSFAIAGAASAQERVKVRFGILTTASQAAFYVGTKKGIFAKYGFDVEVLPLATGVQANQSLAAGQVDWSGGGVESTVVAWATELPFKAYSMYAKGGDSYGILVRKEADIKTPADLKGKKVAVPQGTAPAQGLNQLIQEAGLPRDAVQRVNANYGNMGQMLIAGSVDAMAGLEPFLTLTQEKMEGKGTLLLRLGKQVQGGGPVPHHRPVGRRQSQQGARRGRGAVGIAAMGAQQPQGGGRHRGRVPQGRAAHRRGHVQVAELSPADRRLHAPVAGHDRQVSRSREADPGRGRCQAASGRVRKGGRPGQGQACQAARLSTGP